jgi:hypothetical protein
MSSLPSAPAILVAPVPAPAPATAPAPAPVPPPPLPALPVPAIAVPVPAYPACPACPACPTRTMVALSLLAARRMPVLRPGRTTNPARPANLEAEIG